MNEDSPDLAAKAIRAAHASQLDDMCADFNDEQRAAVEAPDGPLLLLAGAGTGKTRVLTTRIAYKLATGQATPNRILAVTFTNKAAREMRLRVGKLVGQAIDAMPWLGTFHSVNARLLRYHAELVGLRSDFTILDTDDQIRLLRQIIRDTNIDEKRWPARMMAALIDRWKNNGWPPDTLPADEAHSFANGQGGQIYTAYQSRLKELNAVDFGDLLLEALRLLRENDDIVRRYRERFAHIFVDEYQDTNTAQYLWLRLLAQEHRNICVVGDDDQSIYRWRGAQVSNILNFEKDFPGTRIIRLERNYRSTPHILGAAAGLIAANEARLGKTLWTEKNDDGEKVVVRAVWDSQEEARRAADDIETYQRDGARLEDMAILPRTGAQMREFEDCFIARAIPYRVIGGPRFYERAEIRDANAYIRLAAQPDDDLAFERICNRPRRGLGDVAVRTLREAARARGVSLFRAAGHVIETGAMRNPARGALAKFVEAVAHWHRQASVLSHTELTEMILDESGYRPMWQADKSPDAPGKLENLDELVRSMKDFEGLTEYLEHIALVLEAAQDDDGEKVSLMTLHAAKGLEFDTVFLPGWEEGLFPHQRSLDEDGTQGLEEERRLAYVGLTRAKKRAIISFAGSRQMHGRWNAADPSRFIGELPEDHVQIGDDAEAAYHARPSSRAPPPSSSHVPETETLKLGDRVFHSKFGYGHITEIDGNRLAVNFDKAGHKKILGDYLERP